MKSNSLVRGYYFCKDTSIELHAPILPIKIGKSVCIKLNTGILVKIVPPNQRVSIVEDGQCKSFMMAITFLGKYNEDTLPEWLLPCVHDVLQLKHNKVTFVNSKISEVPVEGTKFDLVSASNLFDWLDMDTAAVTLTDVAEKALLLAVTLTNVAEKTLSLHDYLLLCLGFANTNSLLQCVLDLCLCKRVSPKHLLEVEHSLMFQNLKGLEALRLSTSSG
jgi:hypothetical protein